MVRYDICPGCGGKSAELVEATGLCPVCHVKRLAEGQKEFNRRLREEIRGARQTEAYRSAEREYARYRKENSNLCRKHGLPTKRQRGCGDFVDLSKEMSNTRPDA